MPYDETHKDYDHDADFLCSLPRLRSRRNRIYIPTQRTSWHVLRNCVAPCLAAIYALTRTLNRCALELFGPMLAILACISWSAGLALLVLVVFDFMTHD